MPAFARYVSSIQRLSVSVNEKELKRFRLFEYASRRPLFVQAIPLPPPTRSSGVHTRVQTNREFERRVKNMLVCHV